MSATSREIEDDSPDWAARAEANEIEPELESDSEDDTSLITKPWNPALIRVDPRPYSVSQVLDMIDVGDLELQPEFQRRRVWNTKQKSLLIESLLLRIPLPAFYFAEDHDGKLQVIDGLQRLSTIYDFVRGGHFGTFKLSKLEYLGETLGKSSFEDLRSQVWGRRILQSSLVANIVDPQTPTAVKFNIFARLNRQGTPLSQQELRHAMSGSRSRKFLASLADAPEFEAATRGSVKNNTRMHDIEMVLRFCAFSLTHYASYASHGSLSEFLNEVTDQLDNSSDVPDTMLRVLTERFVQSMRLATTAFDGLAFRKISYDGPKVVPPPINKPLFDVWSYFLSALPRNFIIPDPKVLQDIQTELLRSPEFVNSISLNTGSNASVLRRFSDLRDAMKEAGFPID